MSPEQQIERSMLAGKDRDELHTIAGAVGVKSATRMRKADLIEAILVAANGTDAPEAATASSTSNGDDTPKPRRAVRSTRASELADDDPIAALAAEENALGAEDDVPIPSPRRPRAAVAERPEVSDTDASTNGDTVNARSNADAGTGTGAGTVARRLVE